MYTSSSSEDEEYEDEEDEDVEDEEDEEIQLLDSSELKRNFDQAMVDNEHDDYSPQTKKKKLSFDLNPLYHIPDEVMFHNILLLLPFKHLLQTRQVCKYFDMLITRKWLNDDQSQLIPTVTEFEHIKNCDFTNLIARSYPKKYLLDYYQNFKNIKNLYCTSLVDAFMLKDVDFKNLESLYLHDCSLNGADILALSQGTHFTNLKILSLDKNKLRGNGNLHFLVNPTTCPKLETLTVVENYLTEECAILFDNDTSNLPSTLQSLFINGNEISHEGQSLLVGNEQFKILSIDGSSSRFTLEKPLKLDYLLVQSSFSCNTDMINNTTITKNFPKVNGSHLQYFVISDLLRNDPTKFFENFFNSPNDHPETHFYLDLMASYEKKRYNRNDKLLGQLHEMKKEWKEAITYYQSNRSWKEIAFIYYSKFKPPNYELALQNFLKINSNSEYNEEIAICYFETRNYSKAFEYFKTLKTPLNQELLESYGVCCYHLNNSSEAVELLSKVESFPSNLHIYAYAYCLLQVDLKRKDLAIELLVKLADSNYQPAILMVASIYMEGSYSFERDSERAIHYYSRIEDDESKFQIGKIYFDNQEYDNAIENLSKVSSNFKYYGRACYLLGVSWKRKNNVEQSLQLFSKSLKFKYFNSAIPIIEYLLDSISYDWNFLLGPEKTKKRSEQRLQDLFKDQFVLSISSHDYDIFTLSLILDFYDIKSLNIDQLQKARIFFLMGEFTSCKLCYQNIQDNEEAEKFLLFYTWFFEQEMQENMNSIIEEYLETNIYAQYLYAENNVSKNPTKAKQIYEKCKSLFSFNNFELRIAMETKDDIAFVNYFPKISGLSEKLIDKIVYYCIERNLIDYQKLLVSQFENSSHNSLVCYEEILKCGILDKEGKETEVLSLLASCYSNKSLFVRCLDHLSKYSTNKIYSMLLNSKTSDFQLFSHLLIWVLYINGNEAKALEFNSKLLKNDEIEKLLSNSYEPIELLKDMYEKHPNSIVRKIYMKKHPKISSILNKAKDLTELSELAITERIVEKGSPLCNLLFRILKNNYDDEQLADIALEMGLGKKACRYYQKCSEYACIGHTYCQGFPDLPIDYHEAIKNFRKESSLTNTNYNLGCCYMNLNQLDDSIEYFKRASCFDSKIYVAKCYIQKGGIENYNRAISYLEKVNYDKLKDDDIKFVFGCCYEDLYLLHDSKFKQQAVHIFSKLQQSLSAKQHLKKLSEISD